MKVLHLNSSDVEGGAARAALSINDAVKSTGINSKVLVHVKKRDEDFVHQVADNRNKYFRAFNRIVLDYIAIKYLTVHQRGRFSYPYCGTNISNHPLIKESDILHIHWINGGFLKIKSLQKLFALNKPVVWTLHDMWAFTGGCHYSGDCLNYLTHCKNCPSLKINGEKDYSFKIFEDKIRLFENAKINFVTCSNWLGEEVKKSALLQNFTVNVIPNPIEINLYKPIDKSEARKKFNLPEDKLLILFGTYTLEEERKGFQYLLKSIEHLHEKYEDLRDKIEILVFGGASKENAYSIPFKTRFLGRLKSIDELTACYNAADVFAAPSLQDNLPNTIMESLACGTPVVAFNTGGIPEMVEHERNGYLAELKSSAELAEGIKWILEDESRRKELNKNAREKVLNNFTPQMIGERYKQLYESLV